MSTIEINPDVVKQLASKISSIGAEVSSVDQRVNSCLKGIKGVSLSVSFSSINNSINSLHGIASETASAMATQDNILASLLNLPSVGSQYFDIKGNIDKILITGHTLTALTLLGTKSINIKMHNPRTKVASISTAKWVQGKGKSSIFRNFAQRTTAFMKKEHTNPAIKFLKNKTGLNKYKTFNGWIKYNFMGIGDNHTVVGMKKLTKSVSKKIFPINVAANVLEEVVKTSDKITKGTFKPSDGITSVSNVAIKSGAAYAGSIAGGTLGAALLGPPGAVAGAFVGGYLGTLAGDWVAGKAEKFIDKHSKTINKAVNDTISKASDAIHKGKEEISKVVDKGKKEVSKTIDKGKELFSQGSKWVSGLLH